MNQKTATGLDWGALLLGILFIIISLLSFRDPAGNLLAIVMVFAVFAIIKGLYELFVRNRLKELTGYKTYMPIVVGILDLVIGVYLLFNLQVGLTILPYIFAIWFIVDSFFNLFTLELARSFHTGYYWFSLIVDILGILIGFMLLFNPLSSALTLSFLVGFYFMMFGITTLVYAFH